MTLLEIKRQLGLPDKTLTKRLRSSALRHLCAGGAELVQLKTWANTIAMRPGEMDARRIRQECLARIAEVEMALLAGVERAKNLPEGTLC